MFILITLHYVIITFDEHDMFNIKNFDFSVENIMYIITYIAVCSCLYTIKYKPMDNDNISSMTITVPQNGSWL